MKYYKINNNKLFNLSEDKIKAGEFVYNSLGKCVKKMYVEDTVYFVEVLESVLTEGETISELTPLQEGMFCKLSINKFKKYEDQDKDIRDYILS